MKRIALFVCVVPMILSAQENLQKQASNKELEKVFTTVKELPITSVKNQYRSGTCWDYATLGYFESEILRKTGKTYDLCEMFVVSKDYMDCATHYVRMHGYSQISEGGSCDDVLEVIRQHGICPENAMPAPGSLTGDSLANFKVFFPELERRVSSIVVKDAKAPMPHWQDSVQAVIEKYVGRCPESFEYEGKTYTPKSFAESLGLDLDDYVSLTSYTHHPFNKWFVIEAPYKWRLKPSYNIPIEQLMNVLDKALDAGYTVAWGGDVTGNFTRTGLAMLPDGVIPTQELRQEQWNDWRFTYDHVMLIYGKAVDEQGKPYYMVKNSWGKSGQYKGIWYMSRDFIELNTTYLFLNRHALSEDLNEQLGKVSTPQDMDDKYATELVKAGTVAPDFKMKTPDGETLQLSKYAQGKTVVLDFWASWCPDCRKDAPEVVRMYEKYHQYGIEFIGISMDTDVEAWKKAIEKYGITYPQVSELKKFKETDIAKAYGVKWIPSMVVIGPDGQVKLSTVLTYKVDKFLSEQLACKLGERYD